MIIFQFAVWPQKKHLFPSFKQVKPMQESILVALRERFDFLVMANGCNIAEEENELRFQLQFPGICTGSDDKSAALMREINFLLSQKGIKLFFQTGILSDSRDSKIELTYESIIRTQETNSKLLAQYNVNLNKIPTQFLCCISLTIMDYPVYIKGGNDRYDLNSLRKWYTTQNTLFDPVRNVYIDPLDIIHDGTLHAEINAYVGGSIENALEQLVKNQAKVSDKSNQMPTQKTLLIELMQKYKLPDASTLHQEKALRMAAALGNLEDLKFLVSLNVNIDQKDNNPTNGKTALHWAVINKNIDCISFLLQQGAQIDISDAKNKTAKMYASESEDSNITSFFDSYDQSTALKQASEKIFSSCSQFALPN